MFSFIRFITCSLLAVSLASCVSPGKQPVEEIDTGSYYKYPAWRLDNSKESEAINVLLNEADALIEKNALNAATDKLERVLRIRSGYAPAWSRLSWVALENNSPKRSVQMAKRSNSFALGNVRLQTLNWSFIRDASKALKDNDAYLRAEQKIKTLLSL